MLLTAFDTLQYFEHYYIFYVVLLLLTAPVYLLLKNRPDKKLAFIIKSLMVISVIIVALYFGLRARDVGSDTFNYMNMYARAGTLDLAHFLKEYNSDIFFYLLMYGFQKVAPVAVFFFFISILLIYGYYKLCTLYFKENAPFLIFCILGTFFLVSLNMNIVRNAVGLGFAFFFLYYKEKQSKWSWLFLVFSIMSHISCLLFVVAYFISNIFKRKANWLIVIWLIAVILSIAGIGVEKLPVIGTYIETYNRISVYLQQTNQNEMYKTGFRLDFTAFNFIFIMLGFFAYYKQAKPRYYIMYLLLSIVFVLYYDIPYSDRIGLFSWIFIPFIVFDFAHRNYFVKYNLNFKVYYLIWFFITLISIQISL